MQIDFSSEEEAEFTEQHRHNRLQDSVEGCCDAFRSRLPEPILVGCVLIGVQALEVF